MFDVPTVFILGAGASWHYGYPTGEDLVIQVIERANALASFFELGARNNSGALPRFVTRSVDTTRSIPVSVWTDAAQEARNLAIRLAEVNPTLIDHFLAQNDDLHDVGRFAIALAIFDCERRFSEAGGNPNHFVVERTRKGRGLATSGIDLAYFKDDWLRFVLYQATARCNPSSNLGNNRITFVTFNYDTSLERRLLSGLSNISHFSAEDIDKFMDNSRFLHVYGKLRERVGLDWKPLNISLGGTYDDQFHRDVTALDEAFEASKGIRTIDGDDKLKNEEVLGAAKSAISAAEVVYILGFGFDPQNVERLNLKQLRPQSGRTRRVFLTNYGGLMRVSLASSSALLGSPETLVNNGPLISSSNHRCQMSIKNVYDAFGEDFESV